MNELATPQPRLDALPSHTQQETTAALNELGLLQGDGTDGALGNALRELQQRAGLPQTGALNEATQTALADALRCHQSMMRNAAAAGGGGAMHDTSAVMAQNGNLAMMRFANLGAATSPASAEIPSDAAAARHMRYGLRRLPTPSLMRRAKALEAALEQAHEASAGTDGARNIPLRREALTSLLALYDQMDARVTAAPLDGSGLPQLDGVQWNAQSPLAGATLDIAPFGQRDAWTAELSRMPRPPHRHTSSTAERTRLAAEHRGSAPMGTVTIPQPQLDVRDAERRLAPSSGGFMPEWSGVAAEAGSEVTEHVLEFIGAESAAFAAEGVGALLNGLMNSVELANGWIKSDNHAVAAGRTFGMEFGVQAVMQNPSWLADTVRDGHISHSELRSLVRSYTPTRRAWDRQIQFRGAALDGLPSRAIDEGLNIAADLMNQALEQARSSLDQQQVTDPSVRADAFAQAAERGARAAYRLLHAHNQEVRSAIRERE